MRSVNLEGSKRFNEDDRNNFEAEIISIFNAGIQDMEQSHLRKSAEESVYNELQIGYAMGIYDQLGMGDDHLYSEAIRIRLAKKLGQCPDSVFRHIQELVAARIKYLSVTFTAGQFRTNLEALKIAALEKTEIAQTHYNAKCLLIGCSMAVSLHVDAHPEDDAPDLNEMIDSYISLEWNVVDKDSAPSVNIQPEDTLSPETGEHTRVFYPGWDDDNPF